MVKGANKQQKVVSFLVIAMLVCGIIVAAILAYTSIRYSYYPLGGEREILTLMQDSVVVHIVFALLVCVGAGVFDRMLFDRFSLPVQERVSKIVLAVTAVLLFVVGTIFVQSTPYYPEGDQLNTTAGSYYCMTGNYIMLSKGGYIGMYEQQKGFMFLYEILFAIFGEFCYKVAAQFHVIFAVLILWAGYGFLKLQFEKVFYRIIYCGIILCCIPLLIYLPYIYGDVPAICFSMILFWALSSYEKKAQKRYIVIAMLVSALALMCRMNTWIVLIAVGIGMVLLAIKEWNYKPIIAALCIILAAAGAIKAIDVMYEIRSGYESGQGIPSVLWIAMGLQETYGEAGIYNRYQQSVFEQNEFEREISAQIGKDYITVRLKEFQADPAMAKNFFWKKMSSQWTEPLFESLTSTSPVKDETPIPIWFQELYYGKDKNTVWKVANYYQSVVYLAVFFCMVWSLLRVKKQDKKITCWIPMITVIGGFLFSLMWENQCRYCLPYYIFMLLYVPAGMVQPINLLEWLFKKRGNACSTLKKN